MKIASIDEGRRFSLHEVQRSVLLEADGLTVEAWSFEAGQRLAPEASPETRSYQVLEGEALLRAGDGPAHRLGKGRVALLGAGERHALENAGGGLLVVLVTRAA